MNPSNIIIRKISKNAEGKDTENAESFRQRKGTFCFRTTRLGNRGVDEVKKHPFFKNDIWDFSTIRDNVPPVVHELSGDDDTRNFDDVENEAPVESFPTPKAFAGNHLPFVGFTYSKDHQLMTEREDERPPPGPGRVRL